MTTPYVQIHGLDFTSIMDVEGPKSSGGGKKIDEMSMPNWKRSYVRETGREKATYSGEVHSSTLQDIKDFLGEVNAAPEDVDFYPSDALLSTYVKYGSARYTKPQVYQAATLIRYHAEFELFCKEPFAYGTRQGITYDTDVSLPASSATLTNSGTETNTIDYFYASGGYDGGHTDDLLLTVAEREIPLCDQLMGHDAFEVSRWGDIEHSYEVDFCRSYNALQADLWGPTFCDGGSIVGDTLVLTDQIVFPFAGPLPVSESPPPTLEIQLDSGDVAIYYAFAGDLSDLTLLDVDVAVGRNTIPIPDCEGEDFLAFGLVGSGTISYLKASVKRYLAENTLPEIDINDSFTIEVSDGEYSNHLLSGLQALYRDKFWW